MNPKNIHSKSIFEVDASKMDQQKEIERLTIKNLELQNRMLEMELAAMPVRTALQEEQLARLTRLRQAHEQRTEAAEKARIAEIQQHAAKVRNPKNAGRKKKTQPKKTAMTTSSPTRTLRFHRISRNKWCRKKQFDKRKNLINSI